MKLKCGVFFALIVFLFSSGNANAVVINEVNTYESEDWVEIYSDTDVDINGYKLFDSTSDIASIEESVIVGPSTSMFYVIEAGNRLNKDSDTVRLEDEQMNELDVINYGKEGQICAPAQGQVIGRFPDGVGSLKRLQGLTPGLPNSNTEAQCPTPTPAPTPTQTPQPTPTPVKTNTPKPTYLPSASPKVLGEAKSPSPTSKSGDEKDTSDFRTPENKPDETPEAEVLADTDRKSNSKLIAIFFTLAGGVFISYPLFRYYKNKNN